VNYVTRLNSDGSRDASFAVGTGFDAGAVSIASATDGSGDVYLAGGILKFNNTTQGNIARVSSDGVAE